jgi:ABC-type multidrug transport system permease subunit
MPLGQGLAQRLNPWTLETILMSGLRTPTFVLGTVMWSYLLSVLFFIPQMVLGVYFFGAHLSINPISLSVSILVSSLIVFSLAVIATGMRLVTKVTDPVSWSVGIASQLLAGMTFPVQHLNDYIPGLSTFSWFLPQTWIYHIVRLSTLEDASLLDPQVATSFLVALMFALILLPTAFRIFRWGLRRAKRDGTLGWY